VQIILKSSSSPRGRRATSRKTFFAQSRTSVWKYSLGPS
jgi:hypothetical protein